MEAINNIGLFYQSSSELFSCVAAIIQSNKGSNFIYITDDHSPEELTILLKEAKTNLENIQIAASANYLLREQIINIGEIEKVFGKTLQPNTIVFLEMTWTIRSPSAAIYIKEFYAVMAKLLESTNGKIFFLYNCHLSLDEQLLSALYSHPHLWSTKKAINNPYFVPAQIFSARDFRGQFNYWMENLMPTFSLQKKSAPNQITGAIQPIYNTTNTLSTLTANTDQGRWKIRCLGKLKVYRVNGELIDWNTQHGATKKIKTLFAYLLYKGEKGAGGEELADMLWPDEHLDTSMNRCYHTIRFLKVVLSPELKHNKSNSPFIIREGGHYQLALPPDSWIDLPMFQELCFRGNGHFKNQNYKEALVCYQSAERLYLGELLQDIPNKYIDNLELDWCWSRRQWYKEMHQKLLLESASIYRSLNNITEALACCDKALAIAPYSEKANIEKLLIFYDANRKDAFQRQYQVYTKTLNKFEMGTPPTTIKDIYHKYLNKF
ncbi:MAG: response regulator receiver protein [Bacteroidetes bacterium]|nr:response regulator receiver protein [Bacteroidota bacterium]